MKLLTRWTVVCDEPLSILSQVLHQSYFTGIGLKAMAVTATRRGITSKQLLLGTESNQVGLSPIGFRV